MATEFERTHVAAGAADAAKGTLNVGSRQFRALDAYLSGHAQQEARMKAGCVCWWKSTPCPANKCETVAYYKKT